MVMDSNAPTGMDPILSLHDVSDGGNILGDGDQEPPYRDNT